MRAVPSAGTERQCLAVRVRRAVRRPRAALDFPDAGGRDAAQIEFRRTWK
jgi:hypothetical protein